MPIGVQLVGRVGADWALLGVAAWAFEALIEVAPREAAQRREADEPEVDHRPRPQQRPEVLGPAERAEVDREPREADRVGRERAERRLVERLERQQPARGRWRRR